MKIINSEIENWKTRTKEIKFNEKTFEIEVGILISKNSQCFPTIKERLFSDFDV